MLDNLQIMLWAITYLQIVFWGIKCRRESCLFMPLLAGCLNFAWEVNALIISHAFWGHLVWLILDVAIISFNVYNLINNRNRVLYCFATISATVILRFIFTIPNVDGMLISVFAIDLLMAYDYVINARKISKYGKIPIAITKLLGDFFAWMAYAQSGVFVNVVGIIVSLLNLYYLSMSLDEMAKTSPKQRRRK